MPIHLTTRSGTDYHVVATTDSKGTVWIAWQGWSNDNFDVYASRVTDEGRIDPVTVASSKANDWSPAIAADAKGNVYVAWDTYDAGNYDVRLRRVSGGEAKTWTVASTPRFEARPAIACDSQGRVWVAYEEGDEEWGKDFSTAEFRKIPFDKNPGNGLYLNRTIRVRCLDNGEWKQPAVEIDDASKGRLDRGKSLPRLAVDSKDGLWLLFRHHPLPTGQGEVWNSFALRFDGRSWSAPRRLAQSANLLDNRPAIAASGDGVLTVHSGDGRTRTQDRDQTDLFASRLSPNGQASGGRESPEARGQKQSASNDSGASRPPLATALVPVTADTSEPAPLVHPNETEDTTRIRAYRVDHAGQKLRLLRGEFHRHTEYTAHRDGDGMLEDAWRYALDAGHLDWMGNGDHDNGLHHEYMWWQIQKMTDLYLHAPHFLSVQSYERSNAYPNGHRNVIMPRRGIRPLPRGDLKGTPDGGTPDTKLLYAFLKQYGGICSSHTSGTNMGTDWRDNDPEAEPVVEIYQGHRHNYEHFGAPRAATKETNIGGYQPDGVVWNALAKGYKLGFQSSSDHISTHISYAIVLTDDFSRAGLIAAFKKRHCYAATDNIILDVCSGEHLMGDVFESKGPPSLDIVVHGTGPVAKLDVIRDNKYVFTGEPQQPQVRLRYTDMDAKPGQTSYYYVRVQQADGSLAWASPMWITVK
jgi:hypothetical protein